MTSRSAQSAHARPRGEPHDGRRHERAGRRRRAPIARASGRSGALPIAPEPGSAARRRDVRPVRRASRPSSSPSPPRARSTDLLDAPAIERGTRRAERGRSRRRPADPGPGRPAVRLPPDERQSSAAETRSSPRCRRRTTSRPRASLGRASAVHRARPGRPRRAPRACATSSPSATGTTSGRRATGSTRPRATRCASARRGSRKKRGRSRDDVARGRALLVCSEILATIGDRERAEVARRGGPRLGAVAGPGAPAGARAHGRRCPGPRCSSRRSTPRSR